MPFSLLTMLIGYAIMLLLEKSITCLGVVNLLGKRVFNS